MRCSPREVRWNEYGYGTRFNGWARELPQQRIRNSLVAADHGPQAHCASLPALDYILFLHRRFFRAADPAGTADSGRRPGSDRHLHQVIHHAWHGDGFLFLVSVDPLSVMQFPVPLDDWGTVFSFSSYHPSDLISLSHRSL